MLYLDNAAATRPLPCAIDAMNAVLRDAWGNPNSGHAMGQIAYDVIGAAKNTVAKCLNCYPDEIIFCGSASEAAARIMWTAECNGVGVDVPATEHDAVYTLPYASATIPPKSETMYFRMLANNETGEIYDPHQHEHRDGCRESIAVDATAAVGHIPVDFHALDVDYLFCDALKFGGVPGCAILLVRRGTIIEEIMHSPTPHTALIAACAAALEWGVEHLDENDTWERKLFSELWWILASRVREGIHINGMPERNYAPHVHSFRFDGVSGAALATMLSNRGVMVSTGAACSTGDGRPSRVLVASGLTEKEASETIRITFSHETTLWEVREAAQIIGECVNHIRALGV